jgi:hypothetical protein
MKLEEDIQEVGIRVCDAAAGAIELYASIAGTDVDDDFPEHLLAAHALANLGSVLTMTMETSGKKLWEWNCDIRRRWNGLPSGQPTPAAPADYFTKFGMRRADLVLFKGDHSKKSETEFLCLVEFKKWTTPELDSRKIRDWFQFVDTCPWGMVCGFSNTNSIEWLRILQDKAEGMGDKFVEGRVARPVSTSDSFQTYARILANSDYKAPAV